MVLNYLLEKGEQENNQKIKNFFSNYFMKIFYWYGWYDENYHNSNFTGSYMWRDNNKDLGSLSSGLGDYPRAL